MPGACGSVNWNWPGGPSVTPLSTIHLLEGNNTLVVLNALKTAPGLFVKTNWNEPLVKLLAPVRVLAVGTGTLLMLSKPEVLGIPLTNTVASAYPGDKPLTGEEAKELADQVVPLAQGSQKVWPLSTLRTCTNG